MSVTTRRMFNPDLQNLSRISVVVDYNELEEGDIPPCLGTYYQSPSTWMLTLIWLSSLRRPKEISNG